MKYSVELVEGKVLFDAAGRPVVQPAVKLCTFDVEATSLDRAMQAAREKGRIIAGGDRLPAVSVSTRQLRGQHVLVATVRAR